MMQSEDKLCVVVLFGGMSSEHEVSRVSAGTFVDNLDRARYEVLTVGITREGRWLCTEATSAQMADGSWEELPGNMPCVISPDRADHGMILFTPSGQVEKLHVDVVIPALHGLWGEDGTVQGLLELAGIPYVGCGVLASAVCMDKAVANALFDAAGIPHTKWLSACRWEIESDLDGVCDGAIAKLGWPIFVKPANAGSSVGITKAHDRDELKQAIALALENDHKVVFEAFVDGHEVECVQERRKPGGHPGQTQRGKAGRGQDLRRHGLHRPELRGSGPLRFLCGARHQPGDDQRDQHLPRLHPHQHVPQAHGARGHPRARPDRSPDRTCAGKDGKAAWITAPSAYLTAAWAA